MRRRNILTAGFFLVLLVVSRWAVAPKHLYYFDSVNFALSLDEFNPAKHQPQPPGYPLFVGLMRLVHLVVGSPEQVLLIAGLVVGFAALLLLWALGSEMYGRDAGYLTAALFVFNPPFWFGGVTNQVRLSLAMCSAGVALAAWRALARQSRGWLYVAFAAIGITMGLRVGLAIMLLPLVLWVWLRNGRSWRALIGGSLAAIIGAAPSVVAIVVSVGGVDNYLALLDAYSKDQFRGTSLLFGASWNAAVEMAKQAAVWSATGALAWIWALPLAGAAMIRKQLGGNLSFLALWFVPPFLFSALIHIGDPDQALGAIPVVCVIGGAILALWQRRSRIPLVAVALLAAGLNVLLFFRPPGRIARAGGYKTVVAVDRETQEILSAIRELRTGDPLNILHYRAFVSWRQLSYYFPDDYVIYLPETFGDIPYTLHRRAAVPVAAGTLLGRNRVVAVCSPADRERLAAQGWRRHGPVIYRELEDGLHLMVGPYTLRHKVQ